MRDIIMIYDVVELKSLVCLTGEVQNVLMVKKSVWAWLLVKCESDGYLTSLRG